MHDLCALYNGWWYFTTTRIVSSWQSAEDEDRWFFKDLYQPDAHSLISCLDSSRDTMVSWRPAVPACVLPLRESDWEGLAHHLVIDEQWCITTSNHLLVEYYRIELASQFYPCYLSLIASKTYQKAWDCFTLLHHFGSCVTVLISLP